MDRRQGGPARFERELGEALQQGGEAKEKPRRVEPDGAFIWRRGPESNRPTRICNPVHNRFATAPCTSKLGNSESVADSDKKGKPTDIEGFPFEYGAGNEARTRDLNLGKVALYQLSYSRVLHNPFNA